MRRQRRALGILISGLFLLAGCVPLPVSDELVAPSVTLPVTRELLATATAPAETIAPSMSAGATALPMPTATPGTIARPTMANEDRPSNGASYNPSISADGHLVAFQSEASNLVPNDTNGVSDIFVYDRQKGTMERMSVAGDGAQGNGKSFAPCVSADGRWVVFWSFASNLVAGDTEECGAGEFMYNCADVFVHDRQTGAIERIAAGGREGLGGGSYRLGISADGRWVAFYSWASNLVQNDTNGHADIFGHDRQTGTTELISLASDGAQGNGDSVEPNISADGRWVAFVSRSSNLVRNDTNAKRDVFVRDRQTGTTRRVSVTSNGTQGDDESGVVMHQEGWYDGPAISADGRWVAFTSKASNLVPDDTNECDSPIFGPHNCYDVFIHDLQTGTTERVSIASDGTPGNSESSSPSISADGRWVAFVSSASNLVAGDSNRCPRSTGESNCPDVFVHDRQAGTTVRVSVASDGTPANEGSGAPSISADGYWVAFLSVANNLAPGDSNRFADIFLHNRLTGQTELVSAGLAAREGGRMRDTLGVDHPLVCGGISESPSGTGENGSNYHMGTGSTRVGPLDSHPAGHHMVFWQPLFSLLVWRL